MRRGIRILSGLLAAALLCAGVAGCEPQVRHTDTDQLAMPAAGERIAVITTSLGVLYARLFPEDAPDAVQNFTQHAEEGYYDGVIFHRVEANYVAQTGDPTGTGSGGKSVWGRGFDVEVSDSLHHLRGAIGMARGEKKNSNGSQFYFVTRGYVSVAYAETQREAGNGALADLYQQQGGIPELDGEYTIFGQVFAGYATLDAIDGVKTEDTRPVEDVRIESIEIVEYEEGLVPQEAFDR